MYLSLLHVNVGNRPGRQWLGNVYRVHQRLWMAFADKQRKASDPFFLGTWSGPEIPEPKPKRQDAGFLFRIERDGPARILVQSAEPPDWGYAFQNAPYLLSCKAQTREFIPVPCKDQRYRFRLLANVINSQGVPRANGSVRTTKSGFTIPRRTRKATPVRLAPLPETLPAEAEESRRVLAARFDPWRAWLAQMAQGFHVMDDEKQPLRIETVFTLVRHPSWDKPKRFNAGIFDGLLEVTDAAAFRQTLACGIGPAKAFGFGLLSIAPAG